MRTVDESNAINVVRGWANALMSEPRMRQMRRTQAGLELNGVAEFLEQRFPLEPAEPPPVAPPGGLLLPTDALTPGTFISSTDTVDRLTPGWFMPMPAFRISGLRYTPEHQAWDCNAPFGEPQRGGLWGSLKPGVVLYAGNDNRPNIPLSWNRGKHVIVDYGSGLIGCACHFDDLLVDTGMEVDGGETLGRIGSTGYATGPHVHQWVERNGVRVDWIAEGHYTPVG